MDDLQDMMEIFELDMMEAEEGDNDRMEDLQRHREALERRREAAERLRHLEMDRVVARRRLQVQEERIRHLEHVMSAAVEEHQLQNPPTEINNQHEEQQARQQPVNQARNAREMDRIVQDLNEMQFMLDAERARFLELEHMHARFDQQMQDNAPNPIINLQEPNEAEPAPAQERVSDNAPQWPIVRTNDTFLRSTSIVDEMFEQEWNKERSRRIRREVVPPDAPFAAALDLQHLMNHRRHDRRHRHDARILRFMARQNRREIEPPGNKRAFLHQRRVELIANITNKLEAASAERNQTRETLLADMFRNAIQANNELLKLVVLVDEFHVDVNAALLHDGSSPLDLAARFDSDSYTRSRKFHVSIYLLVRGATVFNRNRTRLEPIFYHATKGDTQDVARILLDLGVNVDAEDENGKTQLWRALKSYNTQQALMLARHSRDLDRQYGERQATILHLATESVSYELVTELLAKGANPLIADVDGKTPLMSACEMHRYSMIRPICKSAKEHGHEVLRQQDKTGKFALHFTAIHVGSPVDQQFEVMRYMLSNGNTFEDRCHEGKSILHYLCASPAHQPLMSRTMELEERIDLVRHVDNQGQTLLHTACTSMRRTKVQYLLGGCPELFHAKDNAGRGAIHATVCSCDRDGDRASLIRELLDHLQCIGGSEMDRIALVDAKDKFGWSPLHLACYYGLKRSALILIKNGANIEATDFTGLRPLHLAFFSGVVVAPMNYGSEAETVTQVLNGTFDEEQIKPKTKPVVYLPRALVLKGADTCAADFSGNLPFFVGAILGQVPASFWMIQAGTSQGLFSV